MDDTTKQLAEALRWCARVLDAEHPAAIKARAALAAYEAQAEAKPAPADLTYAMARAAMVYLAERLVVVPSAYVDGALRAALAAAPAAPAPDRVYIPTNAEQAAGMVSVAMAWLKEHAPDRLAAPAAPAPDYTEGHCTEKAKPGGCQLHNLHCGYPACDRKPAAPDKKEKPNGRHDGLRPAVLCDLDAGGNAGSPMAGKQAACVASVAAPAAPAMVPAFRTSFAYDVGFKDGQKAASQTQQAAQCRDPFCACRGGPCAECPEGQAIAAAPAAPAPVPDVAKRLRELASIMDECKQLRSSTGSAQRTMREAADLLAAPAAPAPVPSGFVLVPVEPTIDQEVAGRDAQRFHSSLGDACRVYKAMLAAAPAAPAPQLPPMPEPHWPRCYQGSVPPGAYTADQMQAYARAAIEAASKGEQA